MIIQKVKFEIDKWGIYITPFIGYSNTPTEGRRFWIGWLKWLWTLKLGESI